MDRSPGFLGSKPREAQLYFTNIALTTCAESMAMWLCACSPFKNVVMSRIHPESSWKWYNKHNIWKQPRYYFFFFPLQIFSFVILFFFVESNAANQCWKMNIKDKIKMGYTCCSPSQKQSWTDMRKFCRKTNWEFYNSHILPIRRRNFVRNLKVGLETISTSGGSAADE